MVTRRMPSMVQQAPDISTDPNAWMDKAACAGWDFKKNGDPFYPVSSAPFAQQPGKKICAACPVISICFEHGQSSADSRAYGTFGGLSQEERRNRNRLRRRADAIEKKRSES